MPLAFKYKQTPKWPECFWHNKYFIFLQILRDSAPAESTILMHCQQGQEDHLFHMVSVSTLSSSNTSSPGKTVWTVDFVQKHRKSQLPSMHSGIRSNDKLSLFFRKAIVLCLSTLSRKGVSKISWPVKLFFKGLSLCRSLLMVTGHEWRSHECPVTIRSDPHSDQPEKNGFTASEIFSLRVTQCRQAMNFF